LRGSGALGDGRVGDIACKEEQPDRRFCRIFFGCE